MECDFDVIMLLAWGVIRKAAGRPADSDGAVGEPVPPSSWDKAGVGPYISAALRALIHTQRLNLYEVLRNSTKMVKHLPPAVKQLLKLRNPQCRPTPPFSRLDAVLQSTFQEAQAKKAENGWLTLAVSASCVARRNGHS